MIMGMERVTYTVEEVGRDINFLRSKLGLLECVREAGNELGCAYPTVVAFHRIEMAKTFQIKSRLLVW